MKNYKVGWFGSPKNQVAQNARAKMHLTQGEKPACGTRLSEGLQFFYSEDGDDVDNVSCERCKRLLQE